MSTVKTNVKEVILELGQEFQYGKNNLHIYAEDEIEDELSNSKYNRDTYMNRGLIYSEAYIIAIKSLGENRYCSKHILDSARRMIEHHHGDKYEDLYFIHSKTNKVLSRTDYRLNEQEVMPTKAMIEMVMENPFQVISIHNHPENTIPSFKDIETCHAKCYKYGLVVCHCGSIYQYMTTENEINKPSYEMEKDIFERKEKDLLELFLRNKVYSNEYKIRHNMNFIEMAAHFAEMGVIVKEVLWNDIPKRPDNFE